MQAENQPRVDVIMGVYQTPNEGIKRAIDSIITQTYKNLRLIICDDGSENDTYSWLAGYTSAESRILLVRHDKNRGLAAALNTCIARTTGQYVARQDAGDYSDSSRLEKQVEFLSKHNGLALVGSSMNMFDESGTWGRMNFPALPEEKDFLFGIPFIHGSIMFKREALLSVGGYKEARLTRQAEDYELLMRMYAKGHRGANIGEPLYTYMEEKDDIKRRKYRFYIDEVMIRLTGFYRLGILKKGLPYIVKPLVVGLIPPKALRSLKTRYNRFLVIRR